MMQPLAFGRKLPRNDWEGDDAHLSWITCTATSAGRAVAWATNGRIDKDGAVYRAAGPISSPDGGQTLQQAAVGVANIAHLQLIIATGWEWADAMAHLRVGGGVILAGVYSSLPRQWRYQDYAAFDHRIWCSHWSKTSGIRTWDPLNPDTKAWGRWLPTGVVQGFALSLGHVDAGYVPLGPL
jgi:hypothetical protein